MASKVWQAGDFISFKAINELQEKADKYDELMAEKEKFEKKETKKK